MITAIMKERQGMTLRVSKEITGIVLLISGCIGVIGGVIADMDVLMYLCAMAGLSGAKMLDKEGGEI